MGLRFLAVGEMLWWKKKQSRFRQPLNQYLHCEITLAESKFKNIPETSEAKPKKAIMELNGKPLEKDRFLGLQSFHTSFI